MDNHLAQLFRMLGMKRREYFYVDNKNQILIFINQDRRIVRAAVVDYIIQRFPAWTIENHLLAIGLRDPR